MHKCDRQKDGAEKLNRRDATGRRDRRSEPLSLALSPSDGSGNDLGGRCQGSACSSLTWTDVALLVRGFNARNGIWENSFSFSAFLFHQPNTKGESGIRKRKPG